MKNEDEDISLDAQVTETGVNIRVKSRFAKAFDIIGGSYIKSRGMKFIERVSLQEANIVSELKIIDAKTENQIKILDAAGDKLAELSRKMANSRQKDLAITVKNTKRKRFLTAQERIRR